MHLVRQFGCRWTAHARLFDGLWESGRVPHRRAYGGAEKFLNELYYDAARSLAKEYKLPMCDSFHIYHEEMADDATMDEVLVCPDGLHLTAAGNLWFAKKLVDALEPIIRVLPEGKTASSFGLKH